MLRVPQHDIHPSKYFLLFNKVMQYKPATQTLHHLKTTACKNHFIAQSYTVRILIHPIAATTIHPESLIHKGC